jgi:DNA repair protein RAD16
VENYADLTDEDYVLLAQQVETSKEKIKEEMEELSPDELVQKAFQGEIRAEPPGLTANLLPFQIEGFSWMRHQEVLEPDIRGGILADEMGMGKTIQTIATILDHRPLLQHVKPGMKHPPTSDLSERQREDKLWEKAAADWKYEMDILKVGKKLRPRDGGARAGTLVVCPVIALTQWKEEIMKFTDGSLSICTYHGPDREKETPRELLKKYDIVLTTYQVMEADFRKMTSPNRVECPNCGGKFKIDKLPIHLKYFCGEDAQRTEAQSRQRRNNDRGGGSGSRGGNSDKKKTSDKKKKSPATKTKTEKKPTAAKVASKSTKVSAKSTDTPRAGSSRSAAKKAATQISRSASDWTEQNADADSESDDFHLASESSSEEEEDSDIEFEAKPKAKAAKAKTKAVKTASPDYDSDSSSSDDSAMERARDKQREALERAAGKGKKRKAGEKKAKAKAKGKDKPTKGKAKLKGKQKGKKKSFDDDFDDEYSSDSSDDRDALDGIDMQELMDKAMAGAKKSPLHSLCWWRIILDEAHMIKTRSSQTANAAFSLIGIHRWALSGTPLQNRVGEFYSLVRFLRLDPMAFYYCRMKDCNCKSMHYRIHAGICEGCNHGGIHHYSHFNKYVLNPIQRDGYTGDGRRALFTLKNEVLDKGLLRRTKETKAADMELPPRLVEIRPVRLHPVEEDFYAALYTQTSSDFNDYVAQGTLLNNYAHIFDLLIRMRQSVDHPYLVIHSNRGVGSIAASSQAGGAPIANGTIDCDLCHEPPTDRVVSSCCGAAYCKSCVLEYMATSNGLANNGDAGLTCPSCRAAFSIDLEVRADVEDDSSLQVAPAAKSSSAGMPSLKELQHVATGSILRRINLAEFATSSKIEALTRELVMMRQQSPGSKAIVFSQFVNMLDLIRWRLHSDPYLEDIGLGARALHGGMNVKARDAALKEFREDNNVRVLLMSLKAGGVALNLTCANHIFLMDPWWNPAAEMQAIDRTHRLGQYRPIRAVRFIAENTVEERILQLQEKKRLVFDGTVGRDAGSLKMLTVDDMKSLFA